MKVGDPVEALLVHRSHPDWAVNFGAILALNALHEYHAPGHINGGGENGDGDARRVIPGDAIGLVRASLVAALEAIDIARKERPSGPIGIVRPTPEEG
jgi:hypothetical protein